MRRIDSLFTTLDPQSLRNQLSNALKGCYTVLDLGCGLESPILTYGLNKSHRVTGVDIWRPYVEKHTNNHDYYECRCADIFQISYPQDSFDAIVITDVIEHLPREKVIESELIDNVIWWSKKRVIIQTPNGPIDNKRTDDNHYQDHVSSWSVNYLESYGFEVHGLNGYKNLRRENGRSVIPWQFLGGNIANMTNPIIYNRPEYAYHLFAVREK